MYSHFPEVPSYLYSSTDISDWNPTSAQQGHGADISLTFGNLLNSVSEVSALQLQPTIPSLLALSGIGPSVQKSGNPNFPSYRTT